MKSNRGHYRPSQEADSYNNRTQPFPLNPTEGSQLFRFGKYKGTWIEDVIYTDRQYVLWACENVPGFEYSLSESNWKRLHPPQPKPVKKTRRKKPKTGKAKKVIKADPPHSSIPDDSDPIPVFETKLPGYMDDALDEPPPW